MKNILKILLTVLLLCMTAAVQAETLTAPMREPDDALTIDELKESREAVWAEWGESLFSDEALFEQLNDYALTYGDVRMRFSLEVFGEKPENGYPLYIAMHGGGADDTPDFNDSQWVAMQNYYTDHLECGVYVAVRGVRDTWDTHFNPESYPLYDRLIEALILTAEVDPNRVYLMGFSAGGDGVYAVGARMADRFAAANMSSGHPNDISMINFYHLPIMLQAGEYDTDFERHLITARYGLILDALQAEYPDGYEHRTFIHADRGHNFEDYNNVPVEVMADLKAYLAGESRETVQANTYPPDWMDDFVRNPIPDTLRWDLNTRAELRETDAFYYLSAGKDAKGIIQIRREGNNVSIAAEDLQGDFSILFNEDMIDFAKPVHFSVEGKGEIDVLLIPEASWLHFTTFDRGDPNYQFEAAVSYAWLLDNLK